MKKKELKFINNLFRFKIIKDKQNNEYVLFKSSNFKHLDEIDDKTEFEAVENHIHLVDDVKPKDRKKLLKQTSYLAKALLYDLNATFPDKKFVVCLSCEDSLIIRFHHVWENEPYYYIAEDFNLLFEKK